MLHVLCVTNYEFKNNPLYVRCTNFDYLDTCFQYFGLEVNLVLVVPLRILTLTATSTKALGVYSSQWNLISLLHLQWSSLASFLKRRNTKLLLWCSQGTETKFTNSLKTPQSKKGYASIFCHCWHFNSLISASILQWDASLFSHSLSFYICETWFY